MQLPAMLVLAIFAKAAKSNYFNAMNLISLQSLFAYWSGAEMGANLTVIMNLIGAMLLGLLVGYERSYHGRAAGMRTYALVCMGSAALTVIIAFPGYWYGGHAALATNPDPTRVIQGIVTGVGFLGAGVILHDGFSTRGLTTAASVWVSSVIGILMGVGFYLSAFGAALLSVFCMTWLTKIEGRLPSRQVLSAVLQFRQGFEPREDILRRLALRRGYEIAKSSISIKFEAGKPEWHFVATALGKHSEAKITELAAELSAFDGIESFHLSRLRN
jgi:putative Mg2+ transporter-C (MgtC) family protein